MHSKGHVHGDHTLQRIASENLMRQNRASSTQVTSSPRSQDSVSFADQLQTSQTRPMFAQQQSFHGVLGRPPGSSGGSRTQQMTTRYDSVQSIHSQTGFASGQTPVVPFGRVRKSIVASDPVLQHAFRNRNSRIYSKTITRIQTTTNVLGSIFEQPDENVAAATNIPQSNSEENLGNEEDFHPYTLRFLSQTVEETFQEYYWDRYSTDISQFWLSTVFLSTAFAIGISFLVERYNPVVAAINAVCFIIPGVIAHRRVNNERFSHQICMAISAIIMLSSVLGPIIGVSLLVSESVYNPESALSMIFVLGIVMPNLRLPFLHSALINLLCLISFLAALFASEDMSQDPKNKSLFIILILVSILVNIRNSQMNELQVRLEFMYSRRVSGETEELRMKIWQLERSPERQRDQLLIDLASPIEVAVLTLKEVLNSAQESLKPKIESVLHMITHYDELLSPNILAQVQGSRNIDDDTSNWLLYEVASRERKTMESQMSFQKPKYSVAMSLRSSSTTSLISPLTIKEGSAVDDYLSKHFSWNWDAFEIDRITQGFPLVYVVLHILRKFKVLERLKIDEGRLKNFLMELASGYSNDVPYHNQKHATDVVLTFTALLTNGRIANFLSDFDLFACVMAAAMHDHGHPGCNNAFHVNAGSTKAIIYNDKSVLESFHISSSWMILKAPKNNFLEGLSTAQKKDFRNTIIDLILATDMAQHFEIMSELKAKIAANTLDFSDVRTKNLLLKVAIKLSDLGHSARTLEHHEKWCTLVQQEFFKQGDKEKEMGLPVSPFMDRETCIVPKSQSGFMNFVATPLFEAFNYSGDYDDVVGQVKANARFWEKKAAEESAPASLDPLYKLPDANSPPQGSLPGSPKEAQLDTNHQLPAGKWETTYNQELRKGHLPGLATGPAHSGKKIVLQPIQH